jgi:hypothetical protein
LDDSFTNLPSEVEEILEMARGVKKKSDSNKVWIYVGVGWLGYMAAVSQGKAIPLRDQVNRLLSIVNERHAHVGVHWSYEKECVIVRFT